MWNDRASIAAIPFLHQQIFTREPKSLLESLRGHTACTADDFLNPTDALVCKSNTCCNRPPTTTTSFQCRLDKRKAVVVGINYFGQRGELSGCIDDAKIMALSLSCAGYPQEGIVVLSDDQMRPSSQPTKMNILLAIHWLIKDASPGDHLTFYYSGHGNQRSCFETINESAKDECLYPVDFRDQGVVDEYDIHCLLGEMLPVGAHLSIIIDSRIPSWP